MIDTSGKRTAMIYAKSIGRGVVMRKNGEWMLYSKWYGYVDYVSSDRLINHESWKVGKYPR